MPQFHVAMTYYSQTLQKTFAGGGWGKGEESGCFRELADIGR